MDSKTAKKYVESLIFSSLEPLSKSDIKKMLAEYGSFDLEKILDELFLDYKDRGIILANVEERFFFKTSDYLKDYLTIQTKKIAVTKTMHVNFLNYSLSLKESNEGMAITPIIQNMIFRKQPGY